MPLLIDNSTPTKFSKPDYLTLDNFRRGVITLINKERLPKNALEKAENCYLVEDGQLANRPGVDWYGTAMPNGHAIEGFDYFDYNGVIHMVAKAGTTIYRSTDNGDNWTACTGATPTTGVWTNMNQYNAFLYLTNGTDDIFRYDGTTTLQSYGTLATPAAPTAAITGLAGTTFSHYYKISRVNQIGFSIASPAVTQTAGQPRASFGASDYITLTLPAPVAGQERYDIYYSEDNVNFYYLDSIISSPTVAGVTYVDKGTAVVIPSTQAPTASTAAGPKVKSLFNAGSRMIGIQDTVNRYRIWFTSGSPPLGAFSSAYDGGYIDWRPGGKEIPVAGADYRDGKGTPLVTIWCDSADGQGATLQLSFDTLTIGDISITIPSAYKLPGSRGTPAPNSLVNVLNDYMFYNSQGYYNLGSRAQFLNLLSTDEASGNIRPTVKEITTAAESNICAVYFDAKVLFSVPRGSSTNNRVDMFDTERKAWIPNAFTIGFSKFLRYTETDGSGNKTQRLLALKPGDTQLSEISDNIQGDYGVAYVADATTGLLSTMKNRFDFQFTEEAELEVSNTQGAMTLEVLGYDRNDGYTSVKSIPLSFDASVSNVGWDTFTSDSHQWDDTSVVATVTSEPSTKRYKPVQRELNAIQWRITSDQVDSRWIVRTLQTWGTPTEAGKPSSWRVRN